MTLLGVLIATGAAVFAGLVLLSRLMARRTLALSTSLAQLAASQAELRASQAQLHLALEAAQAGVWRWDRHSDTTVWSDEAWRLGGLDPAQQPANGPDWLTSVDPRDLDEVKASVARAMQTRSSIETLWRVRDCDPELPRWLMSRGRPQFDADGRLVGYLGVVIDISDKLQAQHALRQSEARLRTLVETLPDLVWLKDPQGVYLACNRRVEQQFNAREADIIGHTDDDFVDAAQAADFRAQDRAAITANAPVVREEEIVFRSDGHRELHQTLKTPIRDAAGELIGVLGVGRDITELRRTTRELETHRRHLENLVEQRTRELATERRRLNDILTGTDAGTWERNIQTGEAAYNERWADIVGYTLEELAPISQDTWMRLVQPDDLQRAQALVERHIRGELPLYECEIRMRHKNGHWVWVHSRGKVTSWSPHGRPLLMSGTHLDISRRKAADLELLRAKEAAEAAALAKGSFLTNMSHEIRTPLNGVLGLAQIGYRENVGRSKAQAAFSRILDSGKVLLAIVNDILDFSKIEAGKLTIEQVPIDPARLIDETVQVLLVLACEKGLALTVETGGLPPAVLGDPMRITQIVYNLCSNAIKFTERGGIRLSAQAQGDALVVAVHDTGIGIEAQVLARLFQPFEQGDSSISRRFGGTGLGLTISRRLAGLMGGTLDVSSTPGLGSTFTLRLPLRPTQLPVPAGSRPHIAGIQRLAGLRVLVAEDNPINQLVLDELLRDEGAQVVLVDDGQRALDAVQQAALPFDVVLMDVQMPGMDGLQATRRLGLSHPGLPVIGQTAHALEEELKRCEAAGMQATLHKPIDLEVLVATLLDQLDMTRRRAGPDTPSPGQAET
jgi:PAS domain S-box-containing protein